MRWLISLYQVLCEEGITMQSKLWFIIIIIFMLGIVFSKESNAQEEPYRFGEFVRLLGGKAIKIDEIKDVEKAVRIYDEAEQEVPGDDKGEGSEIRLNRILLCQSGYNFALKTKGDEVWLNYDTRVRVMEKDRNKGNIIIMEGEICADELNETVFQLEIGETTVNIEPKKCRRFYLKYYEKEKKALISRSSGEITMSFQGTEGEVKEVKMDESSQVAEIESQGNSPDVQKYVSNNLPPDLSEELSVAKKWQDTLEGPKAKSPITTPFWRKPKFYIPTAAVAAGITAAVLYLAREQEAEVRIQIGMP
jgi:hypothetical protein